ncbi:MAG TPA: hypothetical protein VMJ35_10285 [Dongiaceae bacterium]|nr:hypothetical protein [Dongiaceae bacterium]
MQLVFVEGGVEGDVSVREFLKWSLVWGELWQEWKEAMRCVRGQGEGRGLEELAAGGHTGE